MFGKKKKSAIVAWTSRKASADRANREFAKHTERMQRNGYEVASVNIVPAGRSKRSWLILGIFTFARGKQVQVAATYRLAALARLENPHDGELVVLAGTPE